MTAQTVSCSGVKYLGFQIGRELNMSQLCALTAREANSFWGCINRNTASRLIRRVIFPLLSFVSTHLEYLHLLWALKHKQGISKLEQAQQKTIGGSGELVFKKKRALESPWLFIVECQETKEQRNRGCSWIEINLISLCR